MGSEHSWVLFSGRKGVHPFNGKPAADDKCKYYEDAVNLYKKGRGGDLPVKWNSSKSQVRPSVIKKRSQDCLELLSPLKQKRRRTANIIKGGGGEMKRKERRESKGRILGKESLTWFCAKGRQKIYVYFYVGMLFFRASSGEKTGKRGSPGPRRGVRGIERPGEYVGSSDPLTSGKSDKKTQSDSRRGILRTRSCGQLEKEKTLASQCLQ